MKNVTELNQDFYSSMSAINTVSEFLESLSRDLMGAGNPVLSEKLHNFSFQIKESSLELYEYKRGITDNWTNAVKQGHKNMMSLALGIDLNKRDNK